MIFRPDGDGWLVITQPAHAWMAGGLVAAWGNEAFTAPVPREAVIMATYLHDIGWMEWDAAPRVGESGDPVNFVKAPLEETEPIWRRAVERVALMDPYAGLLVSLHATTIYRRRLERQADPPEQERQVQRLLDEQLQYQARLQKQLQHHPLYGPVVENQPLQTAYRWLRVCDLLSLALLSGTMADEGEIEAVPAASRETFTTLRYATGDPWTLEVDPFPFERRLELPLAVRRLAQKRFADTAALRYALDAATWQTITLVVRPTMLTE